MKTEHTLETITTTRKGKRKIINGNALYKKFPQLV